MATFGLLFQENRGWKRFWRTLPLQVDTHRIFPTHLHVRPIRDIADGVEVTGDLLRDSKNADTLQGVSMSWGLQNNSQAVLVISSCHLVANGRSFSLTAKTADACAHDPSGTLSPIEGPMLVRPGEKLDCHYLLGVDSEEVSWIATGNPREAFQVRFSCDNGMELHTRPFFRMRGWQNFAAQKVKKWGLQPDSGKRVAWN